MTTLVSEDGCQGGDMSNQQLHVVAAIGAVNEAKGEDMTEAGERQARRSWVDHAAAAAAWEHEHAAEWTRVDRKLRGIAARRATLDAEEARLLRYAEEIKLWRAFGFGSLLEYVERAMGYAPRTAVERLRVARAIAELPLIADALEGGALAHSAVRELSRVAIPETEDAWLEAARGKSLREIEAMVSGHKPGDLPTDPTEPRFHRKTVTIELSPETYDLLRTMHKLAAEEHGQRLSDDELISSLFRRAYGDGGAIGGNVSDDGAAGRDVARDASDGDASDGSTNGDRASAGDAGGRGASDGEGHARSSRAGAPAYKIAIKQCPDCKRAWQFSGGRDMEVRPEVAEIAACDAVHLGSLDAPVPERMTTTVTPRKREQVLARDGYRCTVPGCRRNVGLDLHHIEYQSRGGGHELWNMISICSLHHKAVHFGKLVIRGTAPDRVTFEFRKPRDRINLTDDDAPVDPAGPHVPSLEGPSRLSNSSIADAAPTWGRERRHLEVR
ncbi:MAG TPA: HNH endonuclease signature motif containing protein [Kofleriaceae bacterium]|nr:HNH endonuclease signature motif containing protein [Kofleriaceae bacterium]